MPVIHTNNDNTFIEEYFMVQVLSQQTQHNCLHVTTDSIPVSSITKINKLNKTSQVSARKCWFSFVLNKSVNKK